MVLNTSYRQGLSVFAVAVACVPAPAFAQYAGKTAPYLQVSDPEYQVSGINVGPVKVLTNVDFDLKYDSNVYAAASSEKDDLVLTVTPKTQLVYSTGATTVRALALVNYRRFADLSSENSTSAAVESEVVWQPSVGQSFTAVGGWNRAVEDRGDPEASNNTTIGPRRSDIFTGRLGYSRQQGRISLKVEGEVRKYDNVSDLDAERDLISYAGRVTLGHRISGSIFATATGFLTKRNFRVPVNIFGVNRNATTYGGRVGVQIDPGGTIEGNASAGMFRLDSASGSIASYSGVSVEASLTYRPRQRTAIIFDAFRGDVATFRLGSVARTDTQVQLGIQQEVRHNIYAQLSTFYRESNFRGAVVNGQSAGSLPESIVGVQGEVEYLLNRNTAVALTGRYTSRDSDDLAEKYSRFRGGVELRLSF